MMHVAQALGSWVPPAVLAADWLRLRVVVTMHGVQLVYLHNNVTSRANVSLYLSRGADALSAAGALA